MSNPLSVTYLTPKNQKRIVAEIWLGTVKMAEINDDLGEIVIKIFVRKAEEPLRFKVGELAEVTAAAAYHLRKK